MAKMNVRVLGLTCLLVIALAVQPAAAQSTGWQRFVDAFVPASIREVFGGSPQEPIEEAAKILSQAEVLELEKPLEGTVAAGENDILRMKFPPNGTEFPNILLTLSVLNDDGDADIYCIPEYLFDISAKPPTRRFSVWKSDHGQGADHIFISRRHELYEDSKYGVQEDGETAQGVSFVCSVSGFAVGGSDYILEVDVDYTERELVAKEMKAMEEIYDQCCLGSPTSCQPWKGSKSEDGSIDMDFCHVPGNVCNAKGRIIRLDLSSLQMDCDFPTAAIAKLEKLEKLNVADNMIKGDIGKIAESLRMKINSLSFVNFKDNMIEGSLSKEVMGNVPVCELTHKGSLAYLNLANNGISGELPACLFDETSSLRELSLDGNKLSGGLPEVSPDSILQALRLKNTGLTGTIPESVGELGMLIVLNLANNSLEGPIPKNLGSASTLISVALSENSLSGTIPGALASGMNMKHLRLEGNELEEFGEEWYTPGWLDMSKLQTVDIGKNSIKGKFPAALLTAPNVQILALDKNQMKGSLPDEPGMFPSAVVLLLSGNLFDGALPEALGDAGFFSKRVRTKSPYLPEFDLSDNELTGEIPDFLHAANVPEYLWEQIRLGGNNFNLPCPLELNFVHIKDLACENGRSPIDDTEIVVSTVPGLGDGDFFDPFPEPEVVPTAVGPETETAVEPFEEPGIEEIEDFDTVEAELASTEDDRDASNSETVVEATEETVSTKATPKTNTASSTVVVGGIGILVLLAVTVAIVAMVVRRRQQQQKSDMVSDVIGMDLEMQNQPEADDGDNVHMLEGVKPSAAV